MRTAAGEARRNPVVRNLSWGASNLRMEESVRDLPAVNSVDLPTVPG
jgi:hypothetical protein